MNHTIPNRYSKHCASEDLPVAGLTISSLPRHSERVVLCDPEESTIKDSLLNGLPRPKGLAMTPGSESGRSLTEMLGVLAIMGILTIGGITGFNYAMNKQRANATVGYVNELAVLGTGQMLAGGTPKLLDYPDHTPSGYPAKITTDTNAPNAFYIEINEVPAPVCSELVSRLDGWKMVNDIGFFDGVKDCGTSDPANMWFEITASADKGLNAYRCNTNADCAGWQDTIGTCDDKGYCEYTCKNGYVQTSIGCCPQALAFNGGCCYGKIDTDEDGNKICCISANAKYHCCKEGEFLGRQNGVEGCISCDDPNAASFYFTNNQGIHAEFCSVCSNRRRSGVYCLPPDPDCPAGKIAKNGKCYCPLDNPVEDQNGNCYPCNKSHSAWPPMLKTAPLELKKYGSSALSFYCNRPTGGGYAGYKQCESGSIGLPGKYTITLADGSSYTVANATGECKSCADFDVSQLKYQAWCESCGGKWVGKAWDKGSCHKP